jgi:hypothetical protein
MREKLSRVILSIYPRAWRERYGEEVRDLADEFATAEPASSWRMTLGLLGSGVRERFRSWRPRHWVAIASTGFALATGGTLIVSETQSQSPRAITPSPPARSYVPTTASPVFPNVFVFNYGEVIKGHPPSGTQCLVSLNPKTGAVIYARSVRNNGVSCGTLLLRNSPLKEDQRRIK